MASDEPGGSSVDDGGASDGSENEEHTTKKQTMVEAALESVGLGLPDGVTKHAEVPYHEDSATSLIGRIAGLVALLGIFIQILVYRIMDQYYGVFGVSPETVGVTPSSAAFRLVLSASLLLTVGLWAIGLYEYWHSKRKRLHGSDEIYNQILASGIEQDLSEIEKKITDTMAERSRLLELIRHLDSVGQTDDIRRARAIATEALVELDGGIDPSQIEHALRDVRKRYRKEKRLWRRKSKQLLFMEAMHRYATVHREASRRTVLVLSASMLSLIYGVMSVGGLLAAKAEINEWNTWWFPPASIIGADLEPRAYEVEYIEGDRISPQSAQVYDKYGKFNGKLLGVSNGTYVIYHHRSKKVFLIPNNDVTLTALASTPS